MIGITGAGGFIGRHLLFSLNEPIRAIVRKGQDFSLGCTEIVQEDLCGSSLYKAFDGVDTIIHLAGLAHKKFKVSEYEDNFKSFKNVVDASVKANVKRFIYVSSISVFEGCDESILFNVLPPFPISISAKFKFQSELFLQEISSSTGMEVVIIRPPIVYGEGVKANFAALMKLVGKGFPLPFRSINQNRRSLVSVYNLVDLIKVCIDHPRAANQVFLVSDDDDMSTSRMVALMAKVQGQANLSLPVPVWCFKLAGKLFRKEAMVDRLVGSLQLDIEHTKKTLDWVPPYSAEHGFKLAAKTKD